MCILNNSEAIFIPVTTNLELIYKTFKKEYHPSLENLKNIEMWHEKKVYAGTAIAPVNINEIRVRKSIVFKGIENPRCVPFFNLEDFKKAYPNGSILIVTELD